MSYKIVGDSCTDFTKEMKEKIDVTLVPLSIHIGDYTVVDDENFNQADFLRRIAEYPDSAKSSCPSPQAYLEAFGDADEVYVITLSSQLSGSYNSAMVAKNDREEMDSSKKVFVFDSMSASVGQTLLALKIKECKDNGYDFDQTVEIVSKYRDEVQTKFVLESLEALRKNGRLSNIAAALCNVLSIKPIMIGTKEGKIDKLSQARGMQKALMKMIESIKEDSFDTQNRILSIAHCNCLERALFVKDEILKLVTFKDVIVVDTAGISSLYASDGGIIVCY